MTKAGLTEAYRGTNSAARAVESVRAMGCRLVYATLETTMRKS
jgi:hypothetical protein